MKTFDNNLNPKSPLPPPTLRDIDASFSSYLIPEKPNTCQPHHHHHPNHNHHTTAGSGRCSSRDDSTSELSIFDAHKYFNEVTNIQKLTTTTSSNNNNSSRVSPVVVNVIPEATRYSSASSSSASASVSSSVEGYSGIRNYRARSFHAATPTASSEASWNSKQGLLSHPPGAISVSMRNPPNPNPNEDLNNNNKLRTSLSKSIRHLRRKCKCPCTDKKSVQVNEKTTTELPKTKKMPSPPPPPPQEITHNWVHVDHTPTTTTTTTNLVATKSQRFPMVTTTVRVPFTDGFTFPVLNPHPNGVVSEEDLPRDSLEVFRPPDEVAVEPKPLSFPFPPAKSGDDNGDSASDASSDLFEIESFSTTGGATQSACPTAIVYRRSSRDSFDEGSAMTECYEPSEASIEWSVTTAEGYDDSGGRGGGGAAAAEQWKRRGGNGLLVMSCRGEKAVSVGPQPVKCGEEGQIGATSAWRHVNGVSAAAGNISSIISTSSGRAITITGSVNKPPLARSHRNTPRVKSLPFAT